MYHMVGALSKQYWWKGLHADIKQYCKSMLGLLGSEGYNCSTIGTIVASSNALVSI